MNAVLNDPKELQNIQNDLEVLGKSGNGERENLFNVIESAKNSGNLEPENYEQLMSSEYLGREFMEIHISAYTDQIKKMQQFLSQLEQKLNEYLQIS